MVDVIDNDVLFQDGDVIWFPSSIQDVNITLGLGDDSIVQEIKIDWDNILLVGDFVHVNGDLETEQGLTTAVIISLFTDKRATEDTLLPDPNNKNRRGWWGDQVSPEVKGDQIGSLRWIVVERAKTVKEVLTLLKQYDEEALQWIIDDGIASDILVEVTRQGVPGNDRLAEKIVITMMDGHEVTIRMSQLL